MGCCGSKRQQAAGSGGRAVAGPLGGAAPVTGARGAGSHGARDQSPGTVGVAFVALGMAPLTLTGAVTGRRYQFGVGGARTVVDERDAAALDSVGALRRVG
jgi:hypothetical protein